ncbi:MAG TPA: AraC family transcriptional regulator [Steroidobacteraceae bacterium]|jgi:AraC-like DNA-binding protein|nr:AraC family transcriptional regulator [Steroidobacteraceae bacterium]
MPMLVEAERRGVQLYPDPAGVHLAHSIDEAREMVGTCLSPHTLKVYERQHQGLATLSALELGDCALATLKYGFPVDIDAGYISEFFMVKWALSGEGHVTSGQRAVSTSNRSLVVTSPYERTGFRMSPTCQHMTTRVSRRVVEERLAEKLGRRLTRPVEFDLEIDIASDFGRAWCQLVAHICQLSASAPTVLACQEVRNQYSRTLIELLIQAAPHTYSESLRAREDESIPWHVRRAQEYVDAHLSDIRSVAGLAAAIGVTPRTLQNGFRQALNMSPADYVRRARVAALHRALLGADSSQSVTSLMLGVGIANFGRYAHYYRQQIGVPPSVTLRRAI